MGRLPNSRLEGTVTVTRRSKSAVLAGEQLNPRIRACSAILPPLAERWSSSQHLDRVVPSNGPG